MDTTMASPGPAAAYAFRFGIFAGAVVGFATIGLLYWQGVLSLLESGYVLMALFPIYLVLVATALSVWLGYDKGKQSLRPVYETDNSD